MSEIHTILESIKIPRMAKIRQRFEAKKIEDVGAEIRSCLRQKNLDGILKPGMRIAVTAGSRGIANMPLILRETCEYLKETGCEPFIIPSMGSHGGATAEGQVKMLAALGVTEETMGVPIHSSMETVCIHEFEDGFKVFVDAAAYGADGIVVVNRIKPHTSFRSDYESGLLKMLCVGLGKQKGAAQIHAWGPKNMGENIRRGGQTILETGKVLFGVAILENGYDQTCELHVLTAEEILKQEPELQERAKRNMPKILLENIDVLVVDRIGKNISGPGMDPNVTYTFVPNSGVSTAKRAKRIVVLDLTEETHGAAVGMGSADFTTQRLYQKIDYVATYTNLLTASIVETGKIPMIMDNQELAIKAGIKTAGLRDIDQVRMVRISDTLHLSEIEVSESMLKEVTAIPEIEIIDEPRAWVFTDGDLF